MAVIVKCDPASLSPGESLNATVAFYGGIRPHLHEPAFVWFSETAGGGGLAWRGQINSLSANDTKQVSLSVDLRRPLRDLSEKRTWNHTEINRKTQFWAVFPGSFIGMP